VNDQGSAADRALATVLVLLTGVSGLVDAASYLNLGHVFVANMTGNIVFFGFALAGAGELSPASSAAAVASFFIGAGLAGRLTRSTRLSRPLLLRATTAIELCLVLIAIGLALISEDAPFTYAIVALLAAAMGVQSTTTSRLQIRGFNSTVVLTTMLSTMAASTRLAGGSGADNGRRMLAISSMLAGGLVGALLTLRVARLAPLILAAVVLAVACAGAHAVARRDK
jgi:uncharacterized membrane protein YoaK (UPF0700 family)